MEEIDKIESKRRKAIINSAMKEFSENNYQKASTNTIVQNAGISKGLLYHYFGTKANLYRYLAEFAFKIVEEKIIEGLDWTQKDLLLRLKQIAMIKFQVFEEYPYLVDFSVKLFQDKSIDKMMRQKPTFPLDLYRQIYQKNINHFLFKDEVDENKAIQIIQWTFEKQSEEWLEKFKKIDQTFDLKIIEDEVNQYIDLLRIAFYKEGENNL
ncbi:TetR/AcrR family transcriptional regulator [Facklamia miroungae]|uniref:DNA-binding transcriptional regulator, AcrR family n=1 Tax=Facklamia miroungae TaxID=120956 RepID=A0A1G7UZJ2_9LACT|nr:TetR/AcrR family transcriptional regulator [Facklamia miroungae]NKZ30202.1 TetR/AcrR family transcriptional regulator [Facklamia miroungae]SDG52691.1 DNA-binding transcriptional regulator, AcrR family [Facklamia miroungae]